MNTSEFIKKHVERINRGEAIKNSNFKYYASVMADDKVIYSYGRHYPLLWQVTNFSGRKLWVLNNAGYSMTTSKHIGKAWPYADIAVELPSHAPITFASVFAAVSATIQSLEAAMTAKKRKDTQVYRSLEMQLSTAKETLSILNS